MDYRRMIHAHEQSKADVTICAVPVESSQAASFGIMRLGEGGRVAGFLEKPKTADELSLVRTDPAWIDAQGIPSRGRDCLASTGIYLFNRRVMLDLLEKTTYQDFGKEIFPAAIRTCKVQVHLFDGYWEDIGTIGAFYEANLGMARPEPTFDPISLEEPIYTRARFLAPTKVRGATVTNCLVSDGCRIEEGAVLENSIIGLRCQIGRGAVIRNSVIMGNDFYQAPGGQPGRPPMGIGAGAHVEGAIIDKNCFIGRDVRVINSRGVENTDETEHGMIVDRIVVIPKGTVLPDGWQQP
jgi:glucose-1-phosphate adenylyltransferase